MRDRTAASVPANTGSRRLRIAAVALVVAVLATGCTPSTNPKPTSPQPPFTGTPAAQTAPELPSAAAKTTSSLSASYSTTDGIVDKDMLMNASQGGYAPMKNLNWLPGQTAQLSSMGLRDIRIDHVFDDSYYQVINTAADGAVTYNFANLDRVVMPLVHNGMTPFFSLSYAPGVSGAAIYKAPLSNTVWAAATTALVAHYKSLGLSGLNWELWNEIDSLYTYTGTLEQYEALYKVSAVAVKAGDSSAKFGGAATSTIGVPGGWSSRFLAWLGANPSVPADFFSYHSYYIDDFSDGPTAQSWLKATGRDIPIYITEWNSNPASGLGVGQGSDTNSSVSGSSYVAKRLFTAIGAGASKIFWFGPVEGADPSKPYLGDLGLVTVDGHRKSVGNVFEMYSHLDNTRLAASISGAGTSDSDIFGLVTKNTATKKTTVLLWNTTTTDSDMDISLTKLPYAKTTFSATQTMVSDHKGNGFADTSTTVDYRYPSPNENAPVVSDSVLSAATSFKKTITIPANGITQLTLLPSTAKTGDTTITAQPSAINLASAGAGAKVTTSSSSDEIPAAGWGTSNLVDGRRHSIPWLGKGAEGWSSAAHAHAKATESAIIDLGKRKAVDTVVLWPRDSAGNEGEGFPADFTISASIDNAKWTAVKTVTGYHSEKPVVGPQTFGIAPASYRYLKVTATKLARPSVIKTVPSFHFQLAELEAYRTGIANGGFESESVKPWSVTGTAKVEKTVFHGGTAAVELRKSGSTLSYALTGLKSRTTYTLGAYVKSSMAGGATTLQAGGATVKTQSTQWSPAWLTFTTGKSETTTMVTVAKSGAGTGWVDDVMLTSKIGQ